MKFNPISRRMFLHGAAGSLAIPLLPSLLPKAAAASVSPSKYIHICSNYSMPRELIYPMYFTPDAVPWTQKDPDTRFQSLQAIAAAKGKVSEIMDASWNPYLPKINVVTNAHAYFQSVLHSTSIYSACSNGLGDNVGPLGGYFYSIDHLIEQAIYKSGLPAIPTLRMNLQGINVGYLDTVSYGTGPQGEFRYPMLTSVQQLKQKLSGLLSGLAAPNSATVSRRSLIDSVLGDYNRLMNHKRISAEDKRRLGDAVELWNQFDRRAASVPALSCTSPNLDTGTQNFRELHSLCMEASVIALSCGLTRNVMMTLYQGGDQDPAGDTFHGWSHDVRDDFGNIPDVPYADAMKWRGQRFLYLLKLLQDTKDENGMPLIDSSLVSWVHEYSNWGHGTIGHALITAGNANGRIETGHHVDAGGAPINKFFLTAMMAMGLTLSDIEKGGRAGYGEYDGTNIKVDDDSSFGRPGPFRSYNSNRRDFFYQNAEKRRPFAYFKG